MIEAVQKGFYLIVFDLTFFCKLNFLRCPNFKGADLVNYTKNLQNLLHYTNGSSPHIATPRRMDFYVGLFIVIYSTCYSTKFCCFRYCYLESPFLCYAFVLVQLLGDSRTYMNCFGKKSN